MAATAFNCTAWQSVSDIFCR